MGWQRPGKSSVSRCAPASEHGGQKQERPSDRSPRWVVWLPLSSCACEFAGEEQGGQEVCPAWNGSAKVSSVAPVLSMRVHVLAGGDGGDGAARVHVWVE